MSNIIGKVLLSQFRVDSFLAAGGMGTVYRVWDLKRNVPLAMKVLHSELADDPSMFKRFQREARALQKLAHPNIVPFYGLYQTMDFSFMLERFVDGPTLKDALKQKKGHPLPLREALTYLKALCAALGYAHANKVVHCDVKPGNVMIDQGGNIYLTDFGIARHAESTTTTMGAAGTPAYMPPEQILGQPVSPATDVYSLGVILYEMLTAQRPFRGAEAGTERSGATVNERVRYGHLHMSPQNPREIVNTIPEELAQVILKALSKNAAGRYASAPEFFDAVCKAVGVNPFQVNERVVVERVGDVRDYSTGKEVIKGAEPVAAGQGRMPALTPGLTIAGVLGCLTMIIVAVLLGGSVFKSDPTPTAIPSWTPFPTRTPRPPTSTPDVAVWTAEAILTQAARVAAQPTKVPTKRPTSPPVYSSIRACVTVNSPARKGPGTSYTITDWVQKNTCFLFDARSSPSGDSCGDVWLRIQANQSGNAYLGNSWVCARNLDASSSEINSLPLMH
jgi:predicted Ser/Thr protein kinase